jgi:hypothetical protein
MHPTRQSVGVNAVANKTSKKSAKVAKKAAAKRDQRSRELGDSKTASENRFSATLLRPAATAKAESWTFLKLPKEASGKLPSQGQTTVEGTLNGLPFRATLEPDGQGGH